MHGRARRIGRIELERALALIDGRDTTSQGLVVWSETYDRPVDDKLMVQEDIASEVTSALRTSID